MKSRPMSASTTATFGSQYQPKIKDFHMNPKVSVYHSNGSGRDSYINYDNGGFRHMAPANYRKVYAVIRNEMVKSANITPKFAIYKSDGYGRDSYIYSTCGGFYKVNNYKGFNNSLRSYDNYTNYKKYDYIHYANNYRTPKEVSDKIALFRRQRATSARLSKPKVY